MGEDSTPMTYALIQRIRHHSALKYLERLARPGGDTTVKLESLRLFWASPEAEPLTDELGSYTIGKDEGDEVTYVFAVFDDDAYENVPSGISLRDFLNSRPPFQGVRCTLVLIAKLGLVKKELKVTVYRNNGVVESWRTQAIEAAKRAIPEEY